MRCVFNVVNRVHLSTRRGIVRRNYTKLMFDQLSIDEKAFKNGHHYITVLSHPRSGCVLEVEEDRTKEACKSLFNRIVRFNVSPAAYYSNISALAWARLT
jgi:hypothetical protein